MADVRNGILRKQLAVHAVNLKKKLTQRIVALRALDGILPCCKLSAVRLKVGALILQR